MQKKIFVRKQNIGTDLPPLVVRTFAGDTDGFKIDINGPSKLLCSKELLCGDCSRVWIEMESPIEIDGKLIP